MPFVRIPLASLQVGLILAWASGYVGAIIAAETRSIVTVLLWRFIGVALLFSPFLWRALRRGVTWRWFLLHAILGAIGMFVCVGLGIESINLGLPAGTGALISALQRWPPRSSPVRCSASGWCARSGSASRSASSA